MSRGVKAKMNEQLARESHQLRSQMIYKIHAAIDVHMNVAEMNTITK